MTNPTLVFRLTGLHRLFVKVSTCLQDPFLLLFRGYFGWRFFQTGLGKLQHFDRTIGFFQDLQIPFPALNVFMAAGTEMVGGLMLLLGLAGRLISLPLTFVLLVAYATAEREALVSIFSDTDKFITATPFPFLLATLTVLCFGPGRLSLDFLIQRTLTPATTAPA